jgi:hypothetical protein
MPGRVRILRLIAISYPLSGLSQRVSNVIVSLAAIHCSSCFQMMSLYFIFTVFTTVGFGDVNQSTLARAYKCSILDKGSWTGNGTACTQYLLARLQTVFVRAIERAHSVCDSIWAYSISCSGHGCVLLGELRPASMQVTYQQRTSRSRFAFPKY